MKVEVHRKKRTVSVHIGKENEEMTFDEAWAFIYLFMRKMASAHRA